jgi:ABC-type uncharacterized transport system fused permease/ATPase subunit
MVQMASYVSRAGHTVWRTLWLVLRACWRKREDEMLTIAFVAMIVALLVVVVVFALMAKDQKRKGQSGTVGTGGEAGQGRASGLN